MFYFPTRPCCMILAKLTQNNGGIMFSLLNKSRESAGAGLLVEVIAQAVVSWHSSAIRFARTLASCHVQ
jgi:hypothetical protein